MKPRSLLVLAAIVVVLAGYVLFFEAPGKQGKGDTLNLLAKGVPERFSIGTSGYRITMRNREGVWYTDHQAVPSLDGEKAARFIAACSRIPYVRRIDTSHVQDLPVVDLTFVFARERERKTRLFIPPGEQRYYLQKDRGDEQVYVASDTLLPGLIPQQVSGWVAGRLADFEPAQVRGLVVGDTRLERAQGWYMTAPLPLRADTSKVKALLQRLRTLAGVQYFSGDLPAGEKFTVKVVLQERTITLDFSSSPEGVFAQNKAQPYHWSIPRQEFDRIRLRQEQIFAADLLAIDARDLTSLRVVYPGKKRLTLVERDGEWRFLSPQVLPPSEENITLVFDAFLSQPVMWLQDVAEDKLTWCYDVFFITREKAKISIYRRGNEFLAKRHSLFLKLLPGETHDLVSHLDAKTFFTSTPFSISLDDVTRMQVRHQGKDFSLVKESGRFYIQAPFRVKASSAFLESVDRHLRMFAVSQYVDAPTTEPRGDHLRLYAKDKLLQGFYRLAANRVLLEAPRLAAEVPGTLDSFFFSPVPGTLAQAFDLPADKVVKVRIGEGSDETAILKLKQGWVVKQKGRVSTDQAEKLAAQLLQAPVAASKGSGRANGRLLTIRLESGRTESFRAMISKGRLRLTRADLCLEILEDEVNTAYAVYFK